MYDFTDIKKIEPFYSYRTPNNIYTFENSPTRAPGPIEYQMEDAQYAVLTSTERAHSHRFLEGFYPVEENNHRWMGKSGIVLIDVPATAKYFFIEGYLPDHFLTDKRFSLSVYIENIHLGDIPLDSPGYFLRFLPLRDDLVNQPRLLVIFGLNPSYVIIPSKIDKSSRDFRELSVIVTTVGVTDHTGWRKSVEARAESYTTQPHHPYFSGRCNVCGIETQFLLDDPAIVRESLLCNYCHSSNRIRQLARGLLKFMQRKGFRVSTIDELSRELDQQQVSIYDTDSTSSISRYLESKKQYITSDYVPGVPSGTQLADRHYCQDLSNLSFADCCFHVVLSSDVMEHVRLYKNALREVFRVLKPGGTFIFNVPFISRMDDHETYVDIVDPEDPDKDSPIRPSVYHGDTLSETGSLLYRIYGKKLFRDLEDVGFLVNYERNTLPQLGIYDCELFVCIKPEQKELNVSSVQCIDLDRREPINSESNPPHECKWFNIELSSICNLRCRWCALDHNKPPQYLSLDRFEYLLKQIAACELPHLERIDLHNGGESLLHPRIDEVLQRLAEYRPKLKQPIHIAVLSNGTVLKESTLNLLVSGKTVDEIRLSIDGGTPKDFEDIRRGAKWPVVSKNVMRILDGIAQAQSKTTLGIICMVPLGKKAEVSWMDPEFRSVIERAHHLEIRHPHTWDGSMPDLNGLTPDPTLKNKSHTCKFLKHNLVVLANGDVTVCCADLNGRGVIGNTDEQNLMDIYRGKRHREMIDLWTVGRFAEIPLCSTCEGYYDFDSAPNPDREHATVSTAFQAEHRAQDRKASLTTRYHQAHGLIKSGDDDEAMEMYRSIYRRFADKSVRASLAAALEQLLARYPGFSAAHNDLGVIDFNKGDVAGAKYHYERAVNQDPANVTALKNLADFYFAAEKQPEQAQILYHRILAEHPDDIETLLAMGHLSNSLGNVADSADFFRRALDISPEYEIAREIIHALSVPESQESA